MKALTFNPTNDTFAIRDLPVPTPGPGDVLVKVAACGLNLVDAKITRWKAMVPDMDADWTPGLDVSGEIVQVGAGVEGWKAGDRVLYHGNMFRPHSGLAEYAIHKADNHRRSCYREFSLMVSGGGGARRGDKPPWHSLRLKTNSL